MDETVRLVITHVLTFIGGYLARYIEPRSRLVHWFPGFFTFSLPFTPPGGAQQLIQVSTHALTIQNLGWRSATNVEIVHGQRPQLFRLLPQVDFTEGPTPTGEHVIRIPSLGRREFVTIQVLTVGNLPPLLTVRSAEGASRMVTTQQTLTVSPRRRIALYALLVVGVLTVVYWVARAIIRLTPPFWKLITR